MKKSSVEKIDMTGFRESGFFNGLSGGNHDQKGAEECPDHGVRSMFWLASGTNVTDMSLL